MASIDNHVLEMLIARLNQQRGAVCQWMIPEDFCILSDEKAVGACPLHPRGIFHKQIEYNGVSYSTFSTSQKDSFITFKYSQSNQIGFGRMFSIFTHSRRANKSQNLSQTWLQVHSFTKVPARLKKFNPYDLVDAPNIQACLRAWAPTQDYMVKLEEIIAHCAWIMHKPGMIHKQLDIPTVALVSTER